MLRRTAAALVLFLFVSGAMGQGSELPVVDAKSFYLMDAASGAVLAESRATEQLDPASLTKLMTAYLAFEALAAGEVALDDVVPVSERAWRAPGSRMFIEVGSQVAFDDLLRGLIIQSGNDAAIAIAERLAGSEQEFVAAMNATAAELGMTGTSFRNPSGLPAREHVSTARDLALLARALIRDFPEEYSRFSEREFTYNEIPQYNRNDLLWQGAGVDGLKTGYTREAGYCLVSSAERDGMRLIAVILGSTSDGKRGEGSLALLEYGFDAWETHRLYTRGETVAQARVFKGNLETLALGPAADVVVTVPRGSYATLGASAALTAELVAPLSPDQVVGDLEVTLGDTRIASQPLVVLTEVKRGSIISRVAGSVALWFD
jgi:D-alanyl-D-alanine carboxypeptidase (penicillin-binding protein 5/6)